MPTFSVISLDRLLEPRSRNSESKPPPVPIRVDGRTAHETAIRKSVPPPNISPALYATPESTPLPDSLSSLSPQSPYMINHKRRGPRLVKSLLQNDESSVQLKLSDSAQNVKALNGNGCDTEEHEAGDAHASQDGPVVYGFTGGKVQNANLGKEIIGAEELVKPLSDDPERDEDAEDFFDLQSTASNSEVDDSYGRWKSGTPLGEYYDALEEISSDGTTQSSYQNIEDELHDMRLNLLMEIQKRKRAEEALENLQNHWQRLSHHLSLVGFRLPLPPTACADLDEQLSLDPAQELSQQVVVARLVADAVARGCARAEVELDMEPKIASKNFEIARLWDRLQYYEAANREMSQRNQEAVEMARQARNRRKRRQKWFWSSICLAITLGGAAIAWSYLPLSEPTAPPEADSAISHEQ